tara:strand:+ start:313 stop:501 length:189 start_codon:yes stop_codon:yes gene_type:complete
MLLCNDCGKIIADSGYEKIHYGICASCPTPNEEIDPDCSDIKCCSECTYWNDRINIGSNPSK